MSKIKKDEVKMLQASVGLNIDFSSTDKSVSKKGLTWSETFVSCLDVQGSVLEPLWEVVQVLGKAQLDDVFKKERVKNSKKNPIMQGGMNKASANLLNIQISTSMEIELEHPLNSEQKIQHRKCLETLCTWMYKARQEQELGHLDWHAHAVQMDHWYMNTWRSLGAEHAQRLAFRSLFELVLQKPLSIKAPLSLMDHVLECSEHPLKESQKTLQSQFIDLQGRYDVNVDEAGVLEQGVYKTWYEEWYFKMHFEQLHQNLKGVNGSNASWSIEKLQAYTKNYLSTEMEKCAKYWALGSSGQVLVHGIEDDFEISEKGYKTLKNIKAVQWERARLYEATDGATAKCPGTKSGMRI